MGIESERRRVGREMNAKGAGIEKKSLSGEYCCESGVWKLPSGYV
jgi:hypothetical protein